MIDAGNELDALVSEKVMGIRAYLDTHVIQGERIILSCWDAPAQEEAAALIPYYSTDIAASWLVVEQMEARGYWCQMRTPFQSAPDGDGYWTGFTPHGTSGWNGKPDHWTSADTLPLAICRAALKAVGEIEP